MVQTYTIAEVAEKNGVSAKTVQNTIKSHPELGIVMQPRVKTILTFNQAANISSLLAQKKSQFAEKQPETAEVPSFSQETENTGLSKNSQFSESENKTAKYEEEIAELRKQVLELTAKASKQEGRIEELEKQISDLKDQRTKSEDNITKLQADLSSAKGLLQTAEENAARAEAEASSYTKSLFGFYRKTNTPKLEG